MRVAAQQHPSSAIGGRLRHATPCSAMAVATGNTSTSTPINTSPPAMPSTPESTAVANTAMRMAAAINGGTCELRGSVARPEW